MFFYSILLCRCCSAFFEGMITFVTLLAHPVWKVTTVGFVFASDILQGLLLMQIVPEA